MVGFLHSSSANREEENKKTIDEPLAFSLPDILDFSLPLTDSFIDFDSIRDWLEEDPPIGPPPYNIDDVGVGEDMSNYDYVDNCNEMGSKEFFMKASDEEVCFVNDGAEKVETFGYLEQEKSNRRVIKKCCGGVIEEGVMVGSLVDYVQESGDVGVVIKCIGKGNEEIVEKIECQEGELGEIRFSIQEELRRVSLNHELNNSDMGGVGGSKMKIDGVVDDEANVAKNDSIDNSVKQSDEIVDISSDEEDDKDEEEPKRKPDMAGRGQTELEEGEIVASEEDEMVAWSDEEDDEDGAEGPIWSKNEIEDLPPVPAVNVTLLPHHHTLPVGIILSISGTQVIVDGIERHNPLNDGSILWITEIRSPLGLVDEIFGPVKNPYYIVRYNSEAEVPAGLQQGTQISFVPDFADHVLNNPNLYRKGYDASGENDEELSEESEFSDDEKEAGYKRMQKMKKRGTNDGKGENIKKNKRNSKNWVGLVKLEQSAGKQAYDLANNVSTQHFVQPPGVSSGTMPTFSSGLTRPSHPLPQFFMTPGSNATTSSNVYLNQDHSQQTAGPGFPIHLQMQSMSWLQGNHPQPAVQAPFLNMPVYQHNVDKNQSLPSNLATVLGQHNFGPCPRGVSPIFLNQSLFGMGTQGQNVPALTNIGAYAVSSSGLQPGSVAQNFRNQFILGMGMQGQNASTFTNAGANPIPPNGFRFQPMASFNNGQGAFQNNENINPGTLPSNGFGPMATSNTGQDAFQNFNPGIRRGGGRRPYHRGGARFGGGRGWCPS